MAGRDIDYERPTLLGCGGCEVRWTALTAAHCSTCHETFAVATTGFDAHRVDGACSPPERVGLRRDRGYWLSGNEQPPGRVLDGQGGSGRAQPPGGSGGTPNPAGSAGPAGKARTGGPGAVRMAGRAG